MSKKSVKIEVVCHCGTVIHVLPCRQHRTKYCSNKCKYEGNGNNLRKEIKKNCLFCHNEFIIRPHLEKRGLGKYCSLVCSNKYKTVDPYFKKMYSENMTKRLKTTLTKENHPRYIDGRNISPDGYVRIYAPEHPHAKLNRVFEHRFVMEKHIGRYLLPGEMVHHKDGNRQNNDISNLELMENHVDHLATHMSEKYGREKSTNGWSTIWNECVVCGKTENRHSSFGMCKPCYRKDYNKKKSMRTQLNI